MNMKQFEYEAARIVGFIKANPDWRKQDRNETRYIHYDYESDIPFLRFGNPNFVVMTYMDHDDDEFDLGFEDDSLRMVAIHVMPFRKSYGLRYPKQQAAYDGLCRDWGAGDWKIHLPPQARTKGASSAAAFADALLGSARDPVPFAD